ncbi:MAG: hypothetical protein Q9217_006998 [Psora testacea]
MFRQRTISLALFVSVAALSVIAKATKLRTRQIVDVVSTDTFLRRGLHAAAVAGNYLYIDGGFFSYISGSGPVIENTTYSLSLDLSKDWTNSSVVLLHTKKLESAPKASAHELFYNEAKNVLYTGFQGQNPRSNSLWALNLDGKGSGTWNVVRDSNISEKPSRHYAGIASGPQTGWLLGGMDLNDTHTLTDILQVNVANRRITSISTPLKLRWTRLHFVPNYGPEGMLLAFGGVAGDGGFTYPDFESIPIFDPAEKRWYNQSTTGEAPAGRAKHCVSGKASLNQTYEIFVYGGHNFSWGPATITFDTIHILTLPAFHWVKVHYTPLNPRIDMTCHAVAGSQVLVVGGLDPMMTWMNGALSTQDPFQQGLGVFDLHNLSWNDHYSINSPQYVQSDAIQQYYAQANQLDSNKLDPGVASLILQANFSKEMMSDPGHPPSNPKSSSRLPAAPTKSPTTKPSHPSWAAIGGAIGGGLFCLTAGILAVIVLLRRRRKARLSKPENHEDSQRSSMINATKPQMINEADRTPCSLQELGSRPLVHEAGSSRDIRFRAWELDSRWFHEADNGIRSGSRTELA